MGNEQRRIVAEDPASPDSIHRAVASLDGGGLVYLAPGSYRVETTIKLRSDVALIGAGPGLTTITLAPGSNCHVFTNDDHDMGNQGIELRGFSLEGNMRAQHRPPDVKGVAFACGGYFKRVKGLIVDVVVAHAIRQTAFHFTLCSSVELNRLEADELGWSGVSTSGTDELVLRRVVVTNSGLDGRHSGIHLDGGRGAYVDAVVDGCTGNGIMLQSKFSPLSDVVVRGVARRSMRGLSLSGDHENGLRNVCLTGDYSDNRECGVLVSSASSVFIVDATFASNATAGIVVEGNTGSRHCAVVGCRITGSPNLVVGRRGNHVVGRRVRRRDAWRSVPLAQRLRSRVARRWTRARSSAAPTQTEPDDDSFDGACNVCGERQVFVRRNTSLREGYRCARCKASLRYRGQADAILRCYSTNGCTSLAEIVDERDFAALSFWEPGVLGPFRAYFERMPHYVVSDFWPDVPPGDRREGVRCEDLMALTFAAGSFDLVVTSDIFEHVRKPYVGFAEVHRVLRPGGRHIFSIPVQEPMRTATVERVDTSDDHDVYILEPRYHVGPKHSQHIVYNDFGRDLLGNVDELGFDTEVIRFESPSMEASRLLTFCSVKR